MWSCCTSEATICLPCKTSRSCRACKIATLLFLPKIIVSLVVSAQTLGLKVGNVTLSCLARRHTGKQDERPPCDLFKRSQIKWVSVQGGCGQIRCRRRMSRHLPASSDSFKENTLPMRWTTESCAACHGLQCSRFQHQAFAERL